ncbi:MAG: hypothetical protein J6X18_14780 [Bacteroidales bacterium]|nr:hypothetical protein [Bacteroidales bacterium]
MKQIIDEETLKIINEELGIADEMRAKSIQIMNWLKPKLPSLMDNAVPTKPGVETNETSGVFRLNNLDTVRIHFNVIFAKNQYCFNDYLKSLPFPYSSYKPETNEITLNVAIINGFLQYGNACGSLQHELNHSYREHRLLDKNIEPKQVTQRYKKAVANADNRNRDFAAISQAVYLYGTNEVSSYENGLYGRLLSAYENDGFSDVKEQNIIATDTIYIMVQEISNFINCLENDNIPILQRILKEYEITLPRLRKICYTSLNRARRAIARATLKARLDYNTALEKNMFINKNVELKPRKQ